MPDNRYAAFQDTGLPDRFRKAYEFAKEAHFRGSVESETNRRHPLLFGQFHPISLAEACREQNLPAFAIEAAILHDVVEKTPVDYDHIESVFDMEVSELVYEFSLNKNELEIIDELTVEQVASQLSRANPFAQTIKILDIMQTLTYLGTKSPEMAQRYVQWACPMSQALTQANDKLVVRAKFLCQWAQKRVYEAQVNSYQHPNAQEMLVYQASPSTKMTDLVC